MGEFDWIRTHFVPLSNVQNEALSLQDDVALLTPPAGKQLVVTTDTINAGIHFLANTEPKLIAQKALRVNLSDLAAKGATPYAYSMALSLPKTTREAWLAAFCSGLAEDQKHYGCFLLGGDTTATDGPLSVTISAYGLIGEGHAILRSGAKPGDHIYVSGTLGDAVAGLHCLQTNNDRHQKLIFRYHLPQPRTTLGSMLIGVASACMDISDGIVQDLGHICRASSVGAQIVAPSIPLSDDARTVGDFSTLLSGGDDYELLFTAPKSAQAVIRGIAKELSLPLTAIGHITDGDDVMILDENNQPISLLQKGYQHF